MAPTKSEILRLMRGLPRKSDRKVLVGQQLSHQRRLLQSSYEDSICDLETTTGKAPAILGCSFRRMEPEFTPEDIALMGRLMLEHWNRGGLVSITPFFHSPWGGGANNIDGRPTWGLEAMVNPGTPAHRSWHRALDQFASEVRVLAENGVVFIFRPFHECTGSWFWWGPKRREEWNANQSRFTASFTAAWRDMHEYLSVRHGLADNIIWAYTAANRNQGRNLSALFPGQEYAELVGCSVYDNDVTITAPGYDELQSCGVPVFLAECGRAYPNTGGRWSNMTVWEAVRTRYPDVVAAQFWASWGDNAQAIVDNADADRFMNDARGITLSDVASAITESAGQDLTTVVQNLRSVEAMLRQKARELTAEADRVGAAIAELSF
jgi:hypothetical protein